MRCGWRKSGRWSAVPQARRLLWAGLIADATYALKLGLVAAGVPVVAVYAPLAGGLIEIGALYYFCDSLLECQRRSRRLRREPLVPLGLVLAIVPPAIELLSYLRRG